MKRRRNLIVVLLLISAMALGVGYAALTQELKIASTASLTAQNVSLDVHFTDTVTIEGQAKAHADASAIATGNVTSPLTATYEITGLTQKNDYVTIEYTIKNSSPDADAVLTKVSSTAGTIFFGDGTSDPGQPEDVAKYFGKEVTLKKDGAVALHYIGTDHGTELSGDALKNQIQTGDSIIRAPNEEMTVQVKVTLNKSLGLDENARDARVSLEGAVVIFNFESRTATPTP